ncbi:MAG: pirin family protein [Saprospiraceae bacterium]|nr:pirin family protein [Saprospiraceae bacterium]
MKKQVIYKTRGHRADIGPIEIYRLVSNNYVTHVGHFVFLDYIPPYMLAQKQFNPNAAHPHRGIATLTYSLSGEFEHFDSRGHRGTIYSGGVQWMKAGNGIVHNEAPSPDTRTGVKLMHGFQFWINLPAVEKKKNPEYMALQAEGLPVLQLDDNAGTLKVVVGEYGGQTSKIPTYAQQYLYHIRLNAGKTFTLPTEIGLEYAAFLPQHDLVINEKRYYHGDLIGFDDTGGDIEFTNNLEVEAEFILFGGEKYNEPFAAQGPFVMTTQEEIREAYFDAQKGKYGKIVYS